MAQAGYPIARLGTTEEIAAACAFLASEEAGCITAQLLGVNGGAATWPYDHGRRAP